MLGIGGGMILVPFLMRRGGRIHQAVATSAALGFPIALAGTLSNIYYGFSGLRVDGLAVAPCKPMRAWLARLAPSAARVPDRK